MLDKVLVTRNLFGPTSSYTLLYCRGVWPAERWGAVARGEMAAGFGVVFSFPESETPYGAGCGETITEPALWSELVAKAHLVLSDDPAALDGHSKPAILLLPGDEDLDFEEIFETKSRRGIWPALQPGLNVVGVIDVEKEIAALRRSFRTPIEFPIWPPTTGGS